jgi:hypothetical protein
MPVIGQHSQSPTYGPHSLCEGDFATAIQRSQRGPSGFSLALLPCASCAWTTGRWPTCRDKSAEDYFPATVRFNSSPRQASSLPLQTARLRRMLRARWMPGSVCHRGRGRNGRRSGPRRWRAVQTGLGRGVLETCTCGLHLHRHQFPVGRGIEQLLAICAPLL